jgi:hypothetical protein
MARTAFFMLPPANSYERPSCSKSTLPNGACSTTKWDGSLAGTPLQSGSSQQPDGMGVTDVLETLHLLWQHEAPQLGTQGGRRHGKLQLKADAALEGCVQAAGLQVAGNGRFSIHMAGNLHSGRQPAGRRGAMVVAHREVPTGGCPPCW